jgi:nucleoside-diphosphate-sugar epimerase
LATYLITGIAGFIGSHLAHALVERGETVRGIDNFSTGRRENLDDISSSIDLREVDLCDADSVAQACEGVDYILHQGALPSVPRSVKDPRTSHESNINGTFNLLEGARAAKVKRVVYAASSSAYGNQPGFPRRETMVPQPIAPYPVQKLTGELYMQSYWRVYGLETVCLRYFNIFGPRQVPDSPYSGVMARFILEMMQGVQPTINGDGEQARDFTYVDNAVQANLLALHAEADKVAGRVFNVATGEKHSLNETYAELARLLNFSLPAKHGPDRAGDIRDSLADISAAAEAIGYQPAIGFREGLARTVAWYRGDGEKTASHT